MYNGLFLILVFVFNKYYTSFSWVPVMSFLELINEELLLSIFIFCFIINVKLLSKTNFSFMLPPEIFEYSFIVPLNFDNVQIWKF